MSRSLPNPPTAAELAILQVLWRRGPATVRQLHADLSAERETGYTTVLKLLQIMHGKGLVTRDESRRQHVYAAAVAEPQTQQRLLRTLLDRAFRGSTRALVMAALQNGNVTPTELQEIRTLLDQLDEEKS